MKIGELLRKCADSVEAFPVGRDLFDAWLEYEAEEAERCEHGVLPMIYCEDCEGWN